MNRKRHGNLKPTLNSKLNATATAEELNKRVKIAPLKDCLPYIHFAIQMEQKRRCMFKDQLNIMLKKPIERKKVTEFRSYEIMQLARELPIEPFGMVQYEAVKSRLNLFDQDEMEVDDGKEETDISVAEDEVDGPVKEEDENEDGEEKEKESNVSDDSETENDDIESGDDYVNAYDEDSDGDDGGGNDD